jgi:hypothetical protein
MQENPYAPPAELEPNADPQKKIHLGAVLRDVVIVFLLSGIGGVIVGIASAGQPLDSPESILALAASSFIFSTIGFTISGCLSPSRRGSQLALVGIGVWRAGLINVALFGISIDQWAVGAIFLVFVMILGGILSALIRPRSISGTTGESK